MDPQGKAKPQTVRSLLQGYPEVLETCMCLFVLLSRDIHGLGKEASPPAAYHKPRNPNPNLPKQNAHTNARTTIEYIHMPICRICG